MDEAVGKMENANLPHMRGDEPVRDIESPVMRDHLPHMRGDEP